uniref:Pentatricopeptide repeat-containing protein At4g11690-like n=1 Tax=Cicer arietinum TaxID=3827 RepID=A0A3Q7YGM8_CICAR|nr:pentatricopeptide repeat-containing protein At4g11690-like [Cicer arietinum]
MNVLGVTPDVNTYNALFNGFIRTCAFDEARCILQALLENDYAPTCKQFITLVNGMCRIGNIKGAMKLQDEMKTLGVSSESVAMSAIIRGLARSWKTDNAIRILDIVLEMQIIPTVATFTALMHTYCKEANVAKALELRSLMEQCHVKLDVAAYSVLISGLCADGDIQTAFKLYEGMKQSDLWPNTFIYMVLIDSFCAGNYHIESEKLLRDLQTRELMSLDLYGEYVAAAQCRQKLHDEVLEEWELSFLDSALVQGKVKEGAKSSGVPVVSGKYTYYHKKLPRKEFGSCQSVVKDESGPGKQSLAKLRKLSNEKRLSASTDNSVSMKVVKSNNSDGTTERKNTGHISREKLIGRFMASPAVFIIAFCSMSCTNCHFAVSSCIHDFAFCSMSCKNPLSLKGQRMLPAGEVGSLQNALQWTVSLPLEPEISPLLTNIG